MASGACNSCGCAQGECECSAPDRGVQSTLQAGRVYTPRSTCYVVALLNSDGQILGTACYSEPPWLMTKYRDTDYAVLFESTAESFETAMKYAVLGYQQFMPVLSKKFPVQ